MVLLPSLIGKPTPPAPPIKDIATPVTPTPVIPGPVIPTNQLAVTPSTNAVVPETLPTNAAADTNAVVTTPVRRKPKPAAPPKHHMEADVPF